jgi:hypothetical protein
MTRIPAWLQEALYLGGHDLSRSSFEFFPAHVFLALKAKETIAAKRRISVARLAALTSTLCRLGHFGRLVADRAIYRGCGLSWIEPTTKLMKCAKRTFDRASKQYQICANGRTGKGAFVSLPTRWPIAETLLRTQGALGRR